MTKILVSSCLLGHKVRYNAKDRSPGNPQFESLLATHEIVPFCPEVSAGLPIPRPPAEIDRGEGSDVLSEEARVVDIQGRDVSDAFILGAHQALNMCRRENIRYALLTEGSPSCGSAFIYDGRFNGTRKAGTGVTAALLEQHGIAVFSEHRIDELIDALAHASMRSSD